MKTRLQVVAIAALRTFCLKILIGACLVHCGLNPMLGKGYVAHRTEWRVYVRRLHPRSTWPRGIGHLPSFLVRGKSLPVKLFLRSLFCSRWRLLLRVGSQLPQPLLATLPTCITASLRYADI